MACKAARSERMRLVELPRREGEKRAPGVELATRRCSGLSAKQMESVSLLATVPARSRPTHAPEHISPPQPGLHCPHAATRTDSRRMVGNPRSVDEDGSPFHRGFRSALGPAARSSIPLSTAVSYRRGPHRVSLNTSEFCRWMPVLPDRPEVTGRQTAERPWPRRGALTSP